MLGIDAQEVTTGIGIEAIRGVVLAGLVIDAIFGLVSVNIVELGSRRPKAPMIGIGRVFAPIAHDAMALRVFMGVDLRTIENAVVVAGVRKPHCVAQFMDERMATGITRLGFGHGHIFIIAYKPDIAPLPFSIRQYRMGLKGHSGARNTIYLLSRQESTTALRNAHECLVIPATESPATA